MTAAELDRNWTALVMLVCWGIDPDDAVHYDQVLRDLKEDVQAGEKTLLGFKRAPAAKGNHHAYEGGLVAHLLEMWDLWEALRPKFLAPPHVTDERVLKAILLHDLHKAHRTYELVSHEPWETRYCDDETDQLMTAEIKSLWLAHNAGITLDPEQMNALLWAEGGFSRIKPKWCSVLAKVCYALDELSGNGLARIRTRTFLDRTKVEPCASG